MVVDAAHPSLRKPIYQARFPEQQRFVNVSIQKNLNKFLKRFREFEITFQAASHIPQNRI